MKKSCFHTENTKCTDCENTSSDYAAGYQQGHIDLESIIGAGGGWAVGGLLGSGIAEKNTANIIVATVTIVAWLVLKGMFLAGAIQVIK